MAKHRMYRCEQCGAGEYAQLIEGAIELPTGWLSIHRALHEDVDFCHPECARTALEAGLPELTGELPGPSSREW